MCIWFLVSNFKKNFFYYYYFFFYFTILYWFCHISTCICHGCTHFPHPDPPSTSLPVPSLWVIPVHQPQASYILHWTFASLIAGPQKSNINLEIICIAVWYVLANWTKKMVLLSKLIRLWFLFNYGTLCIIHFYKVFHVKLRMILGIHIYRSKSVNKLILGHVEIWVT